MNRNLFSRLLFLKNVRDNFYYIPNVLIYNYVGWMKINKMQSEFIGWP